MFVVGTRMALRLFVLSTNYTNGAISSQLSVVSELAQLVEVQVLAVEIRMAGFLFEAGCACWRRFGDRRLHQWSLRLTTLPYQRHLLAAYMLAVYSQIHQVNAAGAEPVVRIPAIPVCELLACFMWIECDGLYLLAFDVVDIDVSALCLIEPALWHTHFDIGNDLEGIGENIQAYRRGSRYAGIIHTHPRL